MIMPVILWTDGLLFLLTVLVVMFILYARGKPHIRQPWARIFRGRIAGASIVVLSAFVLVGLLVLGVVLGVPPTLTLVADLLGLGDVGVIALLNLGYATITMSIITLLIDDVVRLCLVGMSVITLLYLGNTAITTMSVIIITLLNIDALARLATLNIVIVIIVKLGKLLLHSIQLRFDFSQHGTIDCTSGARSVE